MWLFCSRSSRFAQARSELMFQTETTAAAAWYRFNQNVLPKDKSLRVNLVITRGVLKDHMENQKLYCFWLALQHRLARVNRQIVNALGLPDEQASDTRAVARRIFDLHRHDVAAWKKLVRLYDRRNDLLFQIRSLRNPFRAHFPYQHTSYPWDDPSTN